jgi:hypothetical protein
LRVESVDADPILGGVVLAAGAGFDGRVVGVVRGVAVEGTVGPFGVVGVLEFV